MTRRIPRVAAFIGALAVGAGTLAGGAGTLAGGAGTLAGGAGTLAGGAGTLAGGAGTLAGGAGTLNPTANGRVGDAIARQQGSPQPGAPGAPIAVSLDSPGANERVSLGTKNEELQSVSTEPSISEDGQRVAFLVTTTIDGQPTTEIDLRDRSNDTTTVIYPNPSSPLFVRGRLPVSHPVISGDGQWIAFQIGYGKQDRIAMWSAATGLFDPIAASDQRLSFAVRPSLSRDGRYLAFIGQSAATSVATAPRYFILDRDTNGLTAVGLDQGGNQLYASQYLGEIAISGDGSTVAYADYVPGEEFGNRQVWRTVVGDKQATLVSASPSGVAGDGDSSQPALNQGGTMVVFASRATKLVDGDTNGESDVFRWTAKGIRRISVAPDGTQANGGSQDPAINTNGRQIAYTSWATNLVPGDTTGPFPGQDRAALTDIFVADMTTSRLSRVSVGVGTTEPNDSSEQPALSASGKQVAFASLATNLIADDQNGTEDVFVRNRLPAVAVATDPTDFGAAPVGAPPGVKRTVTVASTGAWAARITGASITGSGAGSYFVSNDACTNTTLEPGSSCTIEITFVPTGEGSMAAALAVKASSPAKANVVHLTGTGSAGRIKLDPVTGPPGTVTVVTGSGFGQGLSIAFKWSTGITPKLLAPVVTDAEGGFTAQVLVLPNDRTGGRNLLVTPALLSGPGTTVSARFTVTTPTGVPPLFGRTQLFRDPFGRVIVLRR